MSIRWNMWPFALLLALAAGCGGTDYGPTGKIGGKLTMDGKPLESGTGVTFMQMEKGFLAYGTTDAEGNFAIKSWNKGDMPIGKYKVSIAPAGGDAPPPQVSVEEGFENPALLDPVVKYEFPAKYRDVTTSGLEFSVQEGENSFDIDIKAKPDKKK